VDKIRQEFLKDHLLVSEADGSTKILPGLVAVLQLSNGFQARCTLTCLQ
jgi:hypothetical protein